jgi:hypothetical protein
VGSVNVENKQIEWLKQFTQELFLINLVLFTKNTLSNSTKVWLFLDMFKLKKKTFLKCVFNIRLCSMESYLTIEIIYIHKQKIYIGYFFKFHLKVGVEELTVNAPLV